MSFAIDSYLERIDYHGPLERDLSTLTALHRQHLLTVPYENVDVQLKRPLGLGPEAAFDKIVNRRRGGWCYEMNTVLGDVLTHIGFDMRRVCGGVNRAVRGDACLGNHLVLLTEVDGVTYIVDTGFGDGFIDPIVLAAGEFSQRGFHYRLEELDDGYWRFHNHAFGGAPSFDFRDEAADEDQLAEQCRTLQTSPESPFVMVLVCQQFTPDGYEIQIGRTARTITPAGETSRDLESADALMARLEGVFGITDPAVAGLWPEMCRRHAEYFGEEE